MKERRIGCPSEEGTRLAIEEVYVPSNSSLSYSFCST
jgi:hypothetical protein